MRSSSRGDRRERAGGAARAVGDRRARARPDRWFNTSRISGSCRGTAPVDDIGDKAIHGMVVWGLRAMYTVR
jgi:hypothetical protein